MCCKVEEWVVGFVGKLLVVEEKVGLSEVYTVRQRNTQDHTKNNVLASLNTCM
jgi:hypothetical protein